MNLALDSKTPTELHMKVSVLRRGCSERVSTLGTRLEIQSHEANRCSRLDQLTHRGGREELGLQHQALQSSPCRLLGNHELNHLLAALQLPRKVRDPVFRLTGPSPASQIVSPEMGDPGFPAPSLFQQPARNSVTPRVFPFMENVEI